MFGSNMNVEAMDKVLSHSWTMRTMFRLASKSAPKIIFREMYLLEYSRKIRAAVEIPLGFLGGVKSLASAEAALREGFDCVVIARALIHDTGLVNKFRSGAVTHSGCTSCNACIAQIYDPAGTRCVLNEPNDLALNQQRASA
jgi:2,4-dienoyl-CoA reductase-like NADH-dependent reductase (Old Yellow Enzyme family)